MRGTKGLYRSVGGALLATVVISSAFGQEEAVTIHRSDLVAERLAARAAAFAKLRADRVAPPRSPRNLIAFYQGLAKEQGYPLKNALPTVSTLPLNKSDPAYLASLARSLSVKPYIWLPDKELRVDDYPQAVALIENVAPSVEPSRICSGTLIASNVVLTASHCVCELGKSPVVVVDSENVRSTWGMRLTTVGSKARISDCTKYKRDTKEEQVQTLESVGDVAVFYLAEEIPAIKPATLNTAFVTQSSYYIVGYGISDADRRPGVKRRATIQGIECDVASSQKYGCNTRFEFWGDGRQINGHLGKPDACGGDSGGPVFQVNPLSPPAIVGVVSRAVKGTDCGQGGVYVRITDEIRQWIEMQRDERTVYLKKNSDS